MPHPRSHSRVHSHRSRHRDRSELERHERNRRHRSRNTRSPSTDRSRRRHSTNREESRHHNRHQSSSSSSRNHHQEAQSSSMNHYQQYNNNYQININHQGNNENCQANVNHHPNINHQINYNNQPMPNHQPNRVLQLHVSPTINTYIPSLSEERDQENGHDAPMTNGHSNHAEAQYSYSAPNNYDNFTVAVQYPQPNPVPNRNAQENAPVVLPSLVPSPILSISFIKYFRKDMISHTTMWPGDILNRQADRFSMSISDSKQRLNELDVELKNARGNVQSKITANELISKRLKDLEMRRKLLENSDDDQGSIYR